MTDEILGLDLDRGLADAHRHGDRKLTVGAHGGGLQAARREGHISIRLGTGWVVSITALTIDQPMTEDEALD